MTTKYRLPKMFYGLRWSFSLDLVDVEEALPATLDVAGNKYEAVIQDAYNWNFIVDIPAGEYDYTIYADVPLLYGRVEVK